MNYCYFLLDHVPATKPHKLWFAVLSEDRSTIAWTEEPPGTMDRGAPWLIGLDVEARRSSTAPALATFLAGGIKDVPPPPTLQADDIATKGFLAAFDDSFDAEVTKTFVP